MNSRLRLLRAEMLALSLMSMPFISSFYLSSFAFDFFVLDLLGTVELGTLNCVVFGYDVLDTGCTLDRWDDDVLEGMHRGMGNFGDIIHSQE